MAPTNKSGMKNKVMNYRSISLLSIFPQIFEKIVTSKLSGLIRGSLSEAQQSQHGFIPGRSTVTNLSVFSNYFSSALNSHSHVGVVYTDFRKAFDSVDRNILLTKLSGFGFHEKLLLRSYLTDRSKTKFRCCRSQLTYVTPSVSQKSHLGFLLFCIFINDLPDSFQFASALLFADDLKLFSRINSLDSRESSELSM